MMKKTVAISLILAGLTLTGCGGAKTEKLIESGNEAFAQQDYATALTEYQQAAIENPELAEPIYNAANVQYRQGEFEQTNATLQVALANADEELAAEGYFNLGNTHFQTEQFAEAVEAYTESLRLNPHDVDAKVNLELALQKLEQEQQEQQQEEQQQEQNQDQQQQEQESQDEQNQDQQSQDEQSQDQQNQDQQNEDQQSQGEQDQEQEQSQDQQGQGEQDQDRQEQEQQSQGEQNQDAQEEEQEQNESESDPQNGEEEAEQPQEQQPQPGQGGGEPTDEEQDPTEMSLGELLEMDGLSEEQARQLLVAAAQGTETLQEYLQQMYVFPYSDVEQDW